MFKEKKMLLLVAFMLALHASVVFATVEIQHPLVKTYSPQKINLFEPYPVRIVVTDHEAMKEVKYLSLLDCGIPFEVASGKKQTGLPVEGYIYAYNGETDFEILASAYHGTASFWARFSHSTGPDGRNNFRSCRISFLDAEKKSIGEASISSDPKGIGLEFYPYSFGIKLPEGFEQTRIDEKNLFAHYSKTGDAGIRISLTTKQFYREGSRDNGFYSYEEIANGAVLGPNWFGKIPDSWETEKFKVGENPVLMAFNCRHGDRRGSCKMYGTLVMPFGPVQLEVDATQNTDVETGKMPEVIEEWKQIARNAIENVYFETGESVTPIIQKTPEETPEEEKSCYSHSDCGEGKKCSVCNSCIEEEEAIKPEDIVFSYTSMNPQLSAEKIKNQVSQFVIIRVFLTPEIKTRDGKNVEKCSVLMPGIASNVVVEAELLNEETFAGFTMGRVTDERKKSSSYEMDNLFEEEHRAIFIIAPSKKEKVVGEIGEITEKIRITAKVNGSEELSETVSVVLEPLELELILHTASNQVEQGTQRGINFEVQGKDSKFIFTRLMLVGPGHLFSSRREQVAEESYKSTDTDRLHFIAKHTDLIQFGYTAPEMGNFDIGKELASLSMVDLQVEAGKQIVRDGLLAYGGEYMQGIEDARASGALTSYDDAGVSALRKYFARNPGSYSQAKTVSAVRQAYAAHRHAENLDLIAKSYKLAKGIHDIKGVHDGIKEAQSDLGDALNLNPGIGEPTTTERVANIGIVAIDVAQLTVGAITFIPNKIPGVSKLSAGVQTAFSAATNIWKANFKYIAKDEKIGRAQVFMYPIMILVSLEDESGWVHEGYIPLYIAYQMV